MERNPRFRPSFFFPIMLITIGVIWLLVNQGLIAVENIYRLIPYWPVLLILIGISILLDRIWWPLTGILWLTAAVAVVWLLVAAPGLLPEAPPMEFQSETFNEPVGDASSAEVYLDLSINPARIYPLEDSSDLITADVHYLGNMVFRVTGSDSKSIRLEETSTGFSGVTRFDWFTRPMPEWEIGLNQEVPIQLTIDASTGQAEIDLSSLQLQSLEIDGSTGRMDITLPEDSDRYPFTLDASTGGVTIQVPDGASVDMDIDASTGRMVIDVPDNAGVQVDVRDGGPGNLNLPDGFNKVREGDDSDEGIWENEAYATTSNPIRIVLDISTGSIEIR